MGKIVEFDFQTKSKYSKKQIEEIIINFQKLSNEAKEDTEFPLELFERINFQKFDRICNKILEEKWLISNYLDDFIEKAKNLLNNELIFSVVTYTCIYDIAEYRKVIRDLPDSILISVLNVLNEYEIPYTEFEPYFNLLKQSQFKELLLNSDQPSHILRQSFDEFPTFKSAKQLAEELIEKFEKQKEKEQNSFWKLLVIADDNNIDEIYRQLKEQMEGMNEFCFTYSQDKFNTMSKLPRMKYLNPQIKQKFYECLRVLPQNYHGLMSLISIMLNLIDIYDTTYQQNNIMYGDFTKDRRK